MLKSLKAKQNGNQTKLTERHAAEMGVGSWGGKPSLQFPASLKNSLLKMLWENTFEPRSLCYLKSYARGETELEPPVVGLDDTGH